MYLDLDLVQLDSSAAPLEDTSQQTYWSVQDANSWLATLAKAIFKLRRVLDCDVIPAKAIGLSGQMHGAVILDQQQSLRQVIWWNDNRSLQETQQLQAALPNIGVMSGLPAVPGFTAPKLLCRKKQEPEIHA